MLSRGYVILWMLLAVVSLLDLAAGTHENGYTLHFSGNINGVFNGILGNWLNQSAAVNGFYEGSFTGVFAHMYPLDGTTQMVGLIFGSYDNAGQMQDIAGLLNGTLNGDITHNDETDEVICDCKKELVIGGFVFAGLFVLALILGGTICCCVKKNNRKKALVSQESRQTANQQTSQSANRPTNQQPSEPARRLANQNQPARQPTSQPVNRRSNQQPARNQPTRPQPQPQPMPMPMPMPQPITGYQPPAPPTLYQDPLAGYPVYPPSQPEGYTPPRQEPAGSYIPDDQPPPYSSVMAGGGQGKKRGLPPMTRQSSIIHMPGAQPSAPVAGQPGPLPQIQPSAPLRGH